MGTIKTDELGSLVSPHVMTGTASCILQVRKHRPQVTLPASGDPGSPSRSVGLNSTYQL